MKHEMVRQGDVLLWARKAFAPTGTRCEEQGRIVLAHGEITGHAHEILGLETDTATVPPAAFYEEPDGTRVLLVERPCALVHQEHGTITLAPGCYQVIRQREYSPSAIRAVAD